MIPIVTIDGPSGSGKGTVCSLLAKKLGWHLLDSGSLYRLTALAAINHQVALDDEPALAHLAATLDVRFEVSAEREVLHIYLDHIRVDSVIRQEKIGLNASKLARLPKVRKSLQARQRSFAKAPGLVADGRDMGTVIFPEAAVKIFLTASVEERAARRYHQLQKQEINVSMKQVLADVKARDRRDTERTVAPLRPADDAVLIDSTSSGIQEVLENIVDILSVRGII